MKQHKKLIDNMLLKESFDLLKQEMSAMNAVEAGSYFKEYCDYYNSVGVFTKYAEANSLDIYVDTFLTQIRTEEYLQSMRSRLQSFVSAETLDLFLAISLKSRKMDNISYIMPFANKDLKEYPSSLRKLIEDQDEEILHYVVNNMVNIHFDNDILLSLSQTLSNDFLRFLIEEKGFSLNEINDALKTNFMTFTAYIKNFDAFSFAVRNFNDSIDWKQIVPAYIDPNNKKDRQPVEMSLIDRCLDIFCSQAIEDNNGYKILYQFYELMLSEEVALRSSEVMRLLVFAKNKKHMFMNSEGGSILIDLFQHRNLRMEEYPESTPLIYSLCAIFIQEATSKSDNNVEKCLDTYKFTKIYLKCLNSNYEIPSVKEFHPLGAGLYLGKIIEKSIDSIPSSKREEILKYKDNFVDMMITHFSDDVNLINPNGVLPIQQVEENGREYTRLMTLGALPVSDEPNIFTSLINSIKKKKIYTVKDVVEIEAQRRAGRNREKDRGKVKDDIKNNLVKLRQNLDSRFKDLLNRSNKEDTPQIIKDVLLQFQDKSTKIVDLMIRQEFFEITDEVRFLRGNFISYTEETLNNYWKLIDVAKNASFDDDVERKITAANDRALIALNKVQKQMNISIKNIASEIEYAVSSNLNLGGQFINDTFEIEEKTLNQKLIRSHEREEKGIDQKNISVFDDDNELDLMKHTSDKTIVNNKENFPKSNDKKDKEMDDFLNFLK